MLNDNRTIDILDLTDNDLGPKGSNADTAVVALNVRMMRGVSLNSCQWLLACVYALKATLRDVCVVISCSQEGLRGAQEIVGHAGARTKTIARGGTRAQTTRVRVSASACVACR